MRSYGLVGLVNWGRMFGGETRFREKETLLAGWMTGGQDLLFDGLNILLGGTCGCFLITDIFYSNFVLERKSDLHE